MPALPAVLRQCSSRGPRIGFVSLGCPKNLVDSEVMMGLLDRAGAEITNRPETADILVVNTCSFIDKAKQESVDTILEMAQHKVSGKARKLIVAGCLVERYRDEIRKNIPEVDAVVGTGELEQSWRLPGSKLPRPPPDQPQLLQHPPRQRRPERAFAAEGDLRESQGRFAREAVGGRAGRSFPNISTTTPRRGCWRRGKSSAYIKIAEGCDHPCSFCVIPNLRGKFRSRRFESVVAEAEQLVAQGVREMTLIGQDTTCYGEDLGMRDGLAQLLDRLAAIPDLKWLRFLYAYPNKITGRLLDTMARHAKICKYLDMPLQHASGPVLKSMRRGGNAEIFLKTIERVRAAVPGCGDSDIVHHRLSRRNRSRLCRAQRLRARGQARLAGSFQLLRRRRLGRLSPGRKSARTDDRGAAPLADAPATSRSARNPGPAWWAATSNCWSRASRRKLRCLWEGRTEHQAPEIDGKVYINDFGPFEQLNPGHFYRCEITESQDYDLVGQNYRRMTVRKCG